MVLHTDKRIAVLGVAVTFLLMIPLVAMQFTDEVDWTLSDFVAAGVLLFGAGLTYELIARRAGSAAYRAALGVAVGSSLFLVWANGAIGLIGNESEPANLMYFGVLAVGFNGAIIARLRPRGMAHALFAMAVSVVLITVIALVAGMQDYPESSLAQILAVNGFFVELFVVSALLFRQAASTMQAEAV